MRSLVVGLVVAVFGLAGCAEPQQANDTLPTAPSTTATSAEPTLEPLGPADFPVPAEAREQTEAGAIAMATYYLDLIDFARDSLDGQLFLDLAMDCETCEQVAAGYASDRDAGYRFSGGDLAIERVDQVTITGRTADLVLWMTQAPSTVFDAQGVELADQALGALRLSGGMVFEWSSIRDVWMVTQLNAERY